MQPLILDTSISSLSPNTSSLITSALPPSYPKQVSLRSALDSLPPSSRDSSKIWAAAQNEKIAESFILLSDSIIQPKPTPARQPDLTANLHRILSDRTEIDHPLCLDCTGLLQSELQKELDELIRERDAYLEFEKEVLKGHHEIKEGELDGYGVEGDEDEWDGLQRKKQELEKEEEKLRRVLREKEGELDRVKKDAQLVKTEEEQLDREEEE